MEPEDLLSGGPDEGPAGADELRGIVARASKRRWRALALASVAALAVGGGIGYAVSNHSSSPQTVVAGTGSNTTSASPANAAAGSSVSGSASAVPGLLGQKYTHLFTRTAGSVTIRGYLTNFTMPKLPAGTASCVAPFLGPRFVAEVSSPAAVGTSEGFESSSTDVLKSVSSSMIGEQEGSPTAVVIAYTGSSAASVKMTFANGLTDQMTPMQGWSVLVGPYPVVNVPAKSIGTLQALDSKDQPLKSTSVELGTAPLPENPVMGPACGCPQPAGGVTPGKAGGASAGSGVASSGAISSGGTEVSEPASNYLCPAMGVHATSPPSRANG